MTTLSIPTKFNGVAESLDTRTSGSFLVQATDVLTDLRIALADILPDGTRTASDLRKLAQVDYRLAWQVHKFVSAKDPLAGSTYLPNQAAFSRFIRARQMAVPKTLIDKAVRAFGDYQDLIKKNAGDRSSFDSMVSASGSDKEEADIGHRRAAYLANSHIFGIQIKSHYFGHIIHSDPGSDVITHLEIVGPIGFRRLRPGAPMALSNTTNANDVNEIPRKLQREPLDSEGVISEGLSVLQRFSTQPIPAVTTQRRNQKWIRTMLTGNEVGTRSELTMLFGSYVRGIPKEGFLDGGSLSISSVNRYPVEILTIDVLVNRPFAELGQPETHVMYDPYGSSAHPTEMHQLAEQLPPRGEVTMPPAGPPLLHCAEVPRYGEMIRYACERMKWKVSDFALYRYQLRYPVLSTQVELVYPVVVNE